MGEVEFINILFKVGVPLLRGVTVERLVTWVRVGERGKFCIHRHIWMACDGGTNDLKLLLNVVRPNTPYGWWWGLHRHQTMT